MSTVKQSIQRLIPTGVKKSTLAAGTDFTPQDAALRGIGTPTPPSSNEAAGPISPLTMVITSTTPRSIPVPSGATSVDVEDAASYTLTDAAGNVYTVSSVTWP